MKFSIVRTDNKQVAHLTARPAKWFFERIKTDTKSGTIDKLREHIVNHGDSDRYEQAFSVARVYPSVEMTKTANGNLEIVTFNGLVTLHVPQLMKHEDAEAVKRSAQMLPMTFGAFLGADGKSVEILVTVSEKGGALPVREAEIDALCQRAYDAVFGIYSGVLPKPIERQTAKARSSFRMTLDTDPYFNPQATPVMLQSDTKPLAPAAEGRTETIEEQREVDMSLYIDYERIYEQAVREAYAETADVVESQRREAYLTELAARLCQRHVPQEEAFLHISRHSHYRDDYDEDVIRAIVDAAYAEGRPQRQKENEMVSRQMRRLIRFLTSRYVFRYNTVMGYTEYRPNNTWIIDWRPCDENAINGMTIEARLANLDVTMKDVRCYVHSDKVRLSDPVDDFLARVSDKWDGKTDHIAMLARCVPCDIPQWETWFKKWFVAMVAQWLLPPQDYGNSVVPLLISRQGDGKTSFCRMILPKELRWGFQENLDVSEKRQTLQSMHNFLLINLDEFNQISPKLQEGFLKNVIQLPSVKIKRPYGKHVEEFKRYASFIATTNETSVLSDPTGSRRFICVGLTAPVRTDYKPNYEALYGQAVQLIRSRALKWWFDADEVRQVMAHNADFEVVPPVIQYFLEYYEPAESTDDGGRWLSPTAIYESLRSIPGSGLEVNGVAPFGRCLWNMPDLQHRRVKHSTLYLVREKPRKAKK